MRRRWGKGERQRHRERERLRQREMKTVTRVRGRKRNTHTCIQKESTEVAVTKDLSCRQSRNPSARRSHLGHSRETRSSVWAHNQTSGQSTMPRR